MSRTVWNFLTDNQGKNCHCEDRSDSQSESFFSLPSSGESRKQSNYGNGTHDVTGERQCDHVKERSSLHRDLELHFGHLDPFMFIFLL